MVDKTEIKNLVDNYSLDLSIIISFILSFLLLLISSLWMLLVIVGIIGGIINRSNVLKSFFSGFSGMMLAQILYFNFHVFEAIEAVNILMNTIGIPDSGLVVFIIILCLWSSYVGLGSLIGSSGYLLFRHFFLNKKYLMVKELDS